MLILQPLAVVISISMELVLRSAHALSQNEMQVGSTKLCSDIPVLCLV